MTYSSNSQLAALHRTPEDYRYTGNHMKADARVNWDVLVTEWVEVNLIAVCDAYQALDEARHLFRIRHLPDCTNVRVVVELAGCNNWPGTLWAKGRH
jgi:hypothetical protein